MDMNTIACIAIVISLTMMGLAALPWKKQDEDKVIDAYAYLWEMVKSIF